MIKLVSAVSKSMDSGLPPSLYDQALEESQPPYERKGLPASEVTIAETLKAQDYYTAHIGKMAPRSRKRYGPPRAGL